MSKVILISIKEKYVQEILSGKKTIELRKSKPTAKPGDVIIIYTTQPVKAVTAVAVIGNIISCSPDIMWKNHSKSLGIDENDFFDYYKKTKKAIGIELKNVTKLDSEILLSAIKMLYPSFSPPQTFKYLNKYSTLKDFKTIQNIDVS
jgi:predicted transcriptional regulator